MLLHIRPIYIKYSSSQNNCLQYDFVLNVVITETASSVIHIV